MLFDQLAERLHLNCVGIGCRAAEMATIRFPRIFLLPLDKLFIPPVCHVREYEVIDVALFYNKKSKKID